ncbi:MAG: response regulator [Gemmobacter sp.]
MPESPMPPDRFATTRQPAPRGAFSDPPTPAMPLTGLTLLAVEDSRFACDALRLMAQRSGARLRRAETLEAAGRHLSVYRPDLVIVDPGLPDGCGLDLVARIAACGSAAPPVLVISGDPGRAAAARRAGAAAFLAKPVTGLGAFRAAVVGCLPERMWLLPEGGGTRVAEGDAPVAADMLALHDDLVQAARRLSSPMPEAERRYVTGFVAGLARASGDAGLAAAAAGAAAGAVAPAPQAMDRLARAIGHRLRARSAATLLAR